MMKGRKAREIRKEVAPARRGLSIIRNRSKIAEFAELLALVGLVVAFRQRYDCRDHDLKVKDKGPIFDVEAIKFNTSAH